MVKTLNLHKDFISPDQTIGDFFKMGLLGVPVVENEKPVAYLTLTHIVSELIPKDVFMHADAIAKSAGKLELTYKSYFERFEHDKVVSHHTIPLVATVEYDDPVVKAVCQMLEHNIPVIAVTKEGKYVGYINYESIGFYLYQFANKNKE